MLTREPGSAYMLSVSRLSSHMKSMFIPILWKRNLRLSGIWVALPLTTWPGRDRPWLEDLALKNVLFLRLNSPPASGALPDARATYGISPCGLWNAAFSSRLVWPVCLRDFGMYRNTVANTWQVYFTLSCVLLKYTIFRPLTPRWLSWSFLGPNAARGRLSLSNPFVQWWGIIKY